MPTKIALTTVGCSRGGVNSEVSATAFGIAPPSPSPVRKRSRMSSRTVFARAVMSAKDAKITTETMTTHRRPYRSAIGPLAIAAIISPNSAAESTAPNAGSGTPRFSDMTGTRKPMHCVSKPSRTITTLHRTMVHHADGA